MPAYAKASSRQASCFFSLERELLVARGFIVVLPLCCVAVNSKPAALQHRNTKNDTLLLTDIGFRHSDFKFRKG